MWGGCRVDVGRMWGGMGGSLAVLCINNVYN